MTRKFILAAAAVAALGAAAMAPTAASAGWHNHHHHWHGYRFGYYPVYTGGSDCYYVKRIVETPRGPRPRRVLVCD